MGSEGLQPTPELDQRRAADLLEGWKAIAEHLDKTERTVQRWEKSKGLPIRRLRADPREEQPRIYAYKSELDSWWVRHTELEDESKTDPIAIRQSAQEPQDTAEADELDRAPKPFNRWILLACSFLLGAVVVATLVWPQIRNRFWPSKTKVVLAVRPFKNLSGNASQDFIAVGLTEEMVSRLGQLHPQKMAVVSLTPVYADADAARLGKDIQANYILEGSVRREGDEMAIAAQLIQVSSHSVVWGQSYSREVKDLLRVQGEVASAIAGEVLSKLPHDSGSERQVNPDAYLAYLEGRYFWNKRTPDNFSRAISRFQKSIEIDPTYAPPYAGLADCYELLGSAPYTVVPPEEAFPKAEAAARQALKLDDGLAEAHVSLGYSYLVYERDYPKAKAEFLRAIELRPDYATAHQFYAYYLTTMGQLDEAIAERKQAVELDPLNPLMTSALGEAYYHARKFDLTIEQNSKSLELDPSYAVALVNIGRAYQQKGMHKEAQEAFEKILELSPDNPAVLSLLGHEYGVSGARTQAEKIIARLRELSNHRYVPAVYIALVYTGLDDKQHAFEWLQKAYAERCEYLVYLPTEPLADPLRGDPRFQQLLDQLGLEGMKKVS
ncbi:MAG TPA: tetratricopeptide repeat protein [Terriglobales bacterium]|nr:tetratricopeptide repeat protein [Terriglobales bacterium]